MTTEQETLEAWTKANVQILSTAFDSATRYSNIFILAGYGSFFGLWNITRDRLAGHHSPMWAALLMLLSVTIFVTFQIYSVYQNSTSLIRFAQALEPPPATLDELIRRYEQYGLDEKKRTPKLVRIWRPMFFATIATGYLAIGILAWSFVRSLLP